MQNKNRKFNRSECRKNFGAKLTVSSLTLTFIRVACANIWTVLPTAHTRTHMQAHTNLIHTHTLLHTRSYSWTDTVTLVRSRAYSHLDLDSRHAIVCGKWQVASSGRWQMASGNCQAANTAQVASRSAPHELSLSRVETNLNLRHRYLKQVCLASCHGSCFVSNCHSAVGADSDEASLLLPPSPLAGSS